ncbi:SusC/RagA family TonB-linked outer membrane protein [Emticicia sp. CRIBPO]|uniref:TonB-dependent receptor n=1 Tax=Emticicia sp. CRIBPO TaxID=2683258 RepID=UPI001412BB6B|nr:TonB-dependent receptor [Emticicia sp. CRIBPO]NBA85532.1 SusC/RagA family TonB-linked outer membrane protein [Emticicia sp. CRIBPO]
MRITLIQIVLSVSFLSISIANDAYSQELGDKRISIRISEQTLKNAIRELEQVSNARFIYSNTVIGTDNKVSIDIKNASFAEVLNRVFAPLKINYTISGNHVVLQKKAAAEAEKTLNKARSEIPGNVDLTITGVVKDQNNEVLPGVSVVLKGTTRGITTDGNGKFSIDVPDSRSVLVFSFVGYQNLEITVGNTLVLEVALKAESKLLEEVVVVGYGTQKKVNLTGAVDQVTAKQLETKSVASIGQALQGVVPNLNITFADGNPVKDPSFNVRGGTSFSGGSFRSGSPLILVDGIPMEINNLNPTDIESLSVLKDAASSAIYGARAAYGVILITTKKGSKDKAPRVSYSYSHQEQSPINRPKQLNSVEYQEAVINAQVLEGASASADDLFKLQQVKNYYANPTTAPSYYIAGGTNIWVANIDPWGEFLKSSAPLKTHNLSVSGGAAKSTYYASLGIRDQEGMIALGDDWRKTYNAMLGFTSDINKWLNIDTKVMYTGSNSKRPHGQGGYSAYSDNYFEFLSRIGWRSLMTPRFTPADSPVGVMPTHTQLNAFHNDGNISLQNSNLLMKIEGTVKLLEGLSFKTNFAYKTISENQKMHLPLVYRVEKTWVPFVEGFSTVSKTFSKSDYTVYNAYFDFFKTIGRKHDISAVAGYNQELSLYRDLTAQGNDLITDAIPVLKLANGAKTFGDNESHWSIRGAFARLNYIFDNKYLLEVNSRYDGTSKFPQGSRFKLFPSVSAGWRISEESFMSGLRSVLPDLKLRASYGSLGNQDVANYAYISSYGLTPQVAYLMNGVRPIGINPPGLVSSDLTWETATTIDFGLDVSFKHKLSATFDWYRRTTRNILTSAEQLPSVLGTSVPNRNTGSLETNGWELSTKYTDGFANGLKYDVSLVLADTRSKVVKFSGNPQQLIASLYEGKQMGEIWGYETVGIFQTADEIKAAPVQTQISGAVWRPGDVRYSDLDGDGKITLGNSTVTNPGDRKIIGNSTPRYQFGINANLGWKNFDFNMFWQGTGKRDYWSGSYLYWGLINGTNINGGIGTPEVYYNSWTPERTDAFYPAFKPALKNMQVQSRYLLNAAFMRLKNVTLGYTVPESLSRKIKIERLRVFTSGFNLLTFSKVPKFMDPENMNDAYPLIRSLTVGAQVNF